MRRSRLAGEPIIAIPREREVGAAVAADRSSPRCRRTRSDDAALRARVRQLLRKLADPRRRFGCGRLHVLLRHEGRAPNGKKTRRGQHKEGLMVRRRRSRRRLAVARTPIPGSSRADSL